MALSQLSADDKRDPKQNTMHGTIIVAVIAYFCDKRPTILYVRI